jgi:hypothetical protein
MKRIAAKERVSSDLTGNEKFEGLLPLCNSSLMRPGTGTGRGHWEVHFLSLGERRIKCLDFSHGPRTDLGWQITVASRLQLISH